MILQKHINFRHKIILHLLIKQQLSFKKIFKKLHKLFFFSVKLLFLTKKLNINIFALIPIMYLLLVSIIFIIYRICFI